MHAAAIVEKIQATAKGDLLGQMQLAEAVKRRFMKRGDVVNNFVQYAPIKSGSAYYKKPTSEQALTVYVENIIVRDIQLVALPKQPDILQQQFSYEPRTARRSCSCSLERAGSSITAPRYHGMLAPSRQRDQRQINTSSGLLPMRAILRRASRCHRPRKRLLGAKAPPSA